MTGANPEGEHKASILGVIRGGERYLFIFDDASFGVTLDTFRRFANNPDLSFSWHDATVLGARLRALRDQPSTFGNNTENGNDPDNGSTDNTTEK
jgi:hypothetical protein